MIKQIKIKLYKKLLRLDGPVMKYDYSIIKVLKRKVLKPVGYHFRKAYFHLVY